MKEYDLAKQALKKLAANMGGKELSEYLEKKFPTLSPPEIKQLLKELATPAIPKKAKKKGDTIIAYNEEDLPAAKPIPSDGGDEIV